MKSRAFRDWSWKLATVIAILGLATPIIAEDFQWQGTIGQGLKASILIPEASEGPAILMRARSADRLADTAMAPGVGKPFSWVVDLRLVVQKGGRTLVDRTPGDLQTRGTGLICIIDSSANPFRDIADIYIGCESKQLATWVKATDKDGLAAAGIIMKSPPLLTGPLLILEFLDWPKEDPMIGGT